MQVRNAEDNPSMSFHFISLISHQSYMNVFTIYQKFSWWPLIVVTVITVKEACEKNLICRAFCRCSWFLRHFTFCRGASGFMNCIPFSNWAYSSLQEQLHSQKDTTANTTTMNNHNRVFGQICLCTFKEKEYIDQNWPIWNQCYIQFVSRCNQRE